MIRIIALPSCVDSELTDVTQKPNVATM